MRLTLRTLLAYLDDTLPPDQAKAIGQKVAESDTAQELIDRIKKVTRRRGLSTPTADNGPSADPNTVADYLSDALSADQLAQFEKACLESDVLLAEAAACHQLLTLLLSEPVRVPPTARQRMYALVKGRESLPNRKPGATVPVAGELPDAPADDADEADAPFLLGLRAFSRSEPWRRRVVPLVAVLGLATAFCVAVYLALPASARRDADVSTRAVAQRPVVFVPLVPAGKPKDEPKPQPDAAAKDTPGPAKSAPPAKAEEKTPPAAKPADPPPGELVPAATKPKADRVAAGRVENPDAVVVSRAGPNGKWLRATAQEPDIFTTDRVVALPGYKAKLRIDPATEIELWANVPEQQPFIPVLETAVTFYPTADGFDADLAVHAGRVYVVAKRPTGVKVRLRFRDEVWDLTLPDDKAEVVVEVVNKLVPGVSRNLDASEQPRVDVALVVLKGTTGLKVRFKDIPQIKPNERVTWTSKGPGLQGPTPLGNDPTQQPSAYYSRYTLPVGDRAKAAQQALADLAARAAERDSIRVAFAEALRDDKNYTPAREFGARLAVLGHAALGEMPQVIEALNDATRPFVRDAAAFALPAALASAPDGVDVFRMRLTEKLSLNDEQTAQVVRFLRGFAPAERRDPATLDRVVEALSNNDLVVREAAFRALVGLIDPGVQTTQAQRMYNAAAPVEFRDAGVKAWKQYVEELKKKPAEKK